MRQSGKPKQEPLPNPYLHKRVSETGETSRFDARGGQATSQPKNEMGHAPLPRHGPLAPIRGDES